MSSFWNSINDTPGRPFSADVLAEAVAALEQQADAERLRRAQPGYCPHQDVVLHPADAARIDGKLCPFGCGRILRGPAS